jgi:hypothetical protein
MLLVEPCIPPFPSYWIACGAENYYVIKNLIASFISFVSLINLMASCAAAAPYGAFLVVFALLGDLRLLKVNGRLRVQTSQLVKQNMFHYRQIQMIVVLFNECYQWVFFTWLLFLTYFVVSFNLFAFVRFHSSISLPGSLFLILLTAEGFAAVFTVNTISGKVYHLSRTIPAGWARHPDISRKVCLKRKIRSCSGIKIKVGSVNFVDRLTPFVICGLCLKLTVRLLISTKQG